MKYLLLFIPFLLLSACNGTANKLADQWGLTEKTRDPIQNKNPSNCPKWKSGQVINITKNTTIPKGCRYDKVSFTLFTSNVTFDCNGAILNGLGKTKRNEVTIPYKKEEVPIAKAFYISGSESNFLQNVTLKNCQLEYYVNGINLGFGLKKSTFSDLKNGRNITALENHLRTLSPKNIRIENVTIKKSHRVGIFIGRYITGLTIHKSDISKGDTGIYLESGTQKIKISHSTFTKNGETSYNPAKRYRINRLINRREAIAIDSSAHNIIENNTFINNEGGAIFIYKNCYERYTDASQLPRYQTSDHNIIRKNHFKDEEKGVWIASRQNRNLENFKCGDPAMLISSDNKKYYQDYAKHNLISHNTFDDVKKGVIVQDDLNTISDNLFKGTTRNDVIIGSEIRTRQLSHPVTGTTVKNNRFSSTANPHVILRFKPIKNTFSSNQPAVSIEASSK